MICDLIGSLGSRQFLNVVNERTCFTSTFVEKIAHYNPQILIVICCIHLHIHHTSRILFLILSFLDFVAFVVRTLIFPLNQRKCAIFSTNVDILPLLFKQAIIAPNKLIGSQHYKRLRRRIIIEFHSPSHFTLTITQ